MNRYLLIGALFCFHLCYAQHSEHKIEVDSIFQVTPNSIYGNNYFLLCSSGNDMNKNFLRIISENKLNVNKNFFWKKMKQIPGFEAFWIEPKKLGALLKHPDVLKESSIDKLTWDDINLNNFELESNEHLFFEQTNNIPNGKWIYSLDTKVIGTSKLVSKEVRGFFANGLAHGSWDKYETIEMDGVLTKFHYHQNYENGIPEGEWYTVQNGIKIKSSFFSKGKPHGKWVQIEYDNDKEFEYKSEMEFKNGFKDGTHNIFYNNQLFFTCKMTRGLLHGDMFRYNCASENADFSDRYLFFHSSYKFGNPMGTWQFYENTGKLVTSIQYQDSSEILMKHYDKNSNLLIEISLFPNAELPDGKEWLFLKEHQMFYFPKNFACNHKTTTYFVNGNVRSAYFFGTEKFTNGKTFFTYFEDGKIKIEGVYGHIFYTYDNQGEIINELAFTDAIYTEIYTNSHSIYENQFNFPVNPIGKL